MRCVGIVFFSLTFTISTFAQILSDIELNKMDSLLIFERDSLTIMHFLDLKDDQIKVLDLDLDGYNQEKQRYYQLIKYIKDLHAYSSAHLEIMVKQYLSFEDRFDIKQAGIKAYQTFQKFRELAREQDNLVALKYYIYAYNIKNRFINNTGDQIFEKLETAHKKYLNHEYTEALIIIENCELLTRTAFIDDSIIKQINLMKKQIKNALSEIELNNKLYQQVEQVTPRFHVGAGMNMLLTNARIDKDRIWYFTASIFGEHYKYIAGFYTIDYTKADLDYNFNIDLSYYFYTRFKITTNFAYGKMQLNSVNKINGFKTNFDVSYYSGQISVNYLFRDQAGIRPYIGPGLRILFITREQLAQEGSFYFVQYYGFIKEKKYTLAQGILNVGIEYISSLDSPLIFQFYSLLYYNLKYNEMIGRFGCYFGSGIGFWF